MFHIIEVLRVPVEEVGLLLPHNHGRNMLAEKSTRIAGPGIAVNAHFDCWVESWDIRQEGKALSAVERLGVPGVWGKGRFEIEQIGVGAHKVGVDNSGREYIGDRAGKSRATIHSSISPNRVIILP